jgi:hypothetical protein
MVCAAVRSACGIGPPQDPVPQRRDRFPRMSHREQVRPAARQQTGWRVVAGTRDADGALGSDPCRMWAVRHRARSAYHSPYGTDPHATSAAAGCVHWLP